MTYKFCPNCGVEFSQVGDLCAGERVTLRFVNPETKSPAWLRVLICKECGHEWIAKTEDALETIRLLNREPPPDRRFADDDIVEQRIYPDLKPILGPTAGTEMVEAIEAMDKVATAVLKRHGYAEARKGTSPAPDRLAQLREKYDPDKDVGIYRNTALRYARDAGCTVLWDETTLIEDRAVIVELLDMLGAVGDEKAFKGRVSEAMYLIKLGRKNDKIKELKSQVKRLEHSNHNLYAQVSECKDERKGLKNRATTAKIALADAREERDGFLDILRRREGHL